MFRHILIPTDGSALAAVLPGSEKRKVLTYVKIPLMAVRQRGAGRRARYLCQIFDLY